MNMPIPNILFDSLYDDDKFKGLKQVFLFYNIVDNGKGDESFEEELKSRIYNETRATNYFQRNLSSKKKDKKLEVSNRGNIDFETDFLIPAIKNIPDYYEYEVGKYIKSAIIYGVDSKIDFFEEQLERLDKEKQLLLKKYNCDSAIGLEIFESLSYCVDYVLDKIDDYKGNSIKKIPFTLSQSKLLSFFSLLHRFEWIDNKCTRDDLSTLISRFFLHSNDKPVKSVRTKFSNKFTHNDKNLKVEAKIEEDLLKLFQTKHNK